MEAITSKPFKSLEELYASLKESHLRRKSNGLQKTTAYVYSGKDVADEKEQLNKFPRHETPRTLICHDMKGGYLEDRFINGSNDRDSYVFYHWSVVDTFVYFSHYFVTVPPYTWINAAHLHGVKVLGTVITEWEPGEQIWRKIFESEAEIKKFADALVMVAKIYNFERWLLNVENKIAKDDVPKLIFFIEYLTDRIHEEIKDSEIIWYDSVTSQGDLKWQNELNDLNKCFFDNCDGIFLNYNWSDSLLAQSCSKVIPEKRVRDIYVGLDVWGRGCPGGGGFESDYALKKIRDHEMSVAIFAPGWTHESFGPEHFEVVENHFWAQLIPFLHVHVPLYDNHIFRTSFCRGVGSNYYHLGQRENERFVSSDTSSTDSPFYNLGSQQPQPSLPSRHLAFLRKYSLSITEPDPDSESLTTNSSTRQEIVPADTEAKNKKETKLFEGETIGAIIRIRDQSFTIETKSSNSNLNDYHMCYELAFNGGGCLRIITKNPGQYHRIFLVHVIFKGGIDLSLVWRSVSPADNEPVLVVRNDESCKIVDTCKTEELDHQWKRRVCIQRRSK